jgi:hypothetical protein
LSNRDASKALYPRPVPLELKNGLELGKNIPDDPVPIFAGVVLGVEKVGVWGLIKP